MKLSNEFKVGLLAIIAVVLLLLGFNFLKGNDLFNNKPVIYAEFSDVSTLQKANPVKINGFSVGTVSDISAADEDISSLKVAIRLNEHIRIPSNSVAYIASGLGGLGETSIIVEKGDAATYLKDGDHIQVRLEKGLLGDISTEVRPVLGKINNALDSLSVVLGSTNSLLKGDTEKNLQQTIANLQLASLSMARMLDDQNSPLAKSLNNVSAITGNLKNNNDSITAILSNTKRFTQQLSQIELTQTIDSLSATVNNLKALSGRLNNTDGTFGALLNDRQLYNKLNDVLLSAEILMDDLRMHPKRYVNISVFGKKDKGGALNSPTVKDSVPQ